MSARPGENQTASQQFFEHHFPCEDAKEPGQRIKKARAERVVPALSLDLRLATDYGV